MRSKLAILVVEVLPFIVPRRILQKIFNGAVKIATRIIFIWGAPNYIITMKNMEILRTNKEGSVHVYPWVFLPWIRFNIDLSCRRETTRDDDEEVDDDHELEPKQTGWQEQEDPGKQQAVREIVIFPSSSSPHQSNAFSNNAIPT